MRLVTTALPLGFFAVLLLGAASPAGCGGGTSAGTAALAGPTSMSGPEGKRQLRARLIGYQETPAISTTGHGTFRATLSEDESTLTFELTYADLEGVGEVGNVTAAHIHLGQRGVAGGVSVALCGAGNRPACPAQPATVTGTIVAADVTGPATQGISPGELAELLRAARAGVTYVNVHTSGFPAGEIRGQLRPGTTPHGDDGRDED